MAKYDPLETHLRRQKTPTYEMSFRDIERILGELLPKGAHCPEWWSNRPNPTPRFVQSQAWLRTGDHAVPHIRSETVRLEVRSREAGGAPPVASQSGG